ncbi:MAG TPA: Gmad2 immunoglobulin-like domain-containing protein [Acidimicrobiales bacterium]
MSQTLPPTGAPRPDDLSPGDEPGAPPSEKGARRPVALIVALVVALAVIAALVAVLVWPDDEDEAVTEPPTTTTEVTASTTTTEGTTTTVAPAPVDTSTAVFPDGAGTTRYDDPVEAARGFAVDFVGFTDPVVGEFMQGDARSGEVEVRPLADGPVTTVFVRQLGPDDTWWVLGSATADIAVDAPATGDAITSPVTVTGSALAFEGQVNVDVRQDGTRSPLGTGFVTGGGDVMRPFTGQIEFSAPTAERGALVFMTNSAENGQVWSAAVLRVAFG